MPLVNTADILHSAHNGGYAVGAFNVYDFHMMEAVVRAAETKRAPVIIQTTPGPVSRYGVRMIVTMAQALAGSSTVPVGLHLDHGTDRAMIHECIISGYTSVMIDASRFPFEENISLTRDVVDEARGMDVAVEAEIGVVAGTGDEVTLKQDCCIYTQPDEAIDFQARSKADFVAVAIGTAHGVYQVEPRLDIEAIRTIRSRADFPLVVHGGSGLSDENVRQLVAGGMSKFNVATQLRMTYISGLRDYISEHPEEYEPNPMVDCALSRLVGVIGDYITVLGSNSKA